MKKAKKRPKLNNLYLILGSAIIILSLLAVFNFQTNSEFTRQDQYKMELFLKKPSGEILKISECNSYTENFECVQTFAKCYEPGEYYSRAVTYYGNTVLSESGWKLTYMC